MPHQFNNHIFSNVAYANAINNYNTATDTIIVNNPGVPALITANIAAQSDFANILKKEWL